jgi:hypothetical protein
VHGTGAISVFKGIFRQKESDGYLKSPCRPGRQEKKILVQHGKDLDKMHKNIPKRG